MKKLLLTTIAALGIFCYSNANADVIFYKDGRTKGDVTATEIRFNITDKDMVAKYEPMKEPTDGDESIGDREINIKRDETIGIIHKGQRLYSIPLKDGEINTNAEFSITIKDKEGKKEVIESKDLEKYITTNNVVPDDEIIKKYEVMKKIGAYAEKIGLMPGVTFSLYRDDSESMYFLDAIEKLSLAEDYHQMIFRTFTDKKELESLEEKLKAEGYDTFTGEITLARGNLTPRDVKDSVANLTETLLHEYWHENSSRKPIDVEEAMAMAVGLHGAEEFIMEHYGASSKEMEKIRSVKEKYTTNGKIIMEYYKKLKGLYSSDKPEKEKLAEKERIFGELKEKTKRDMNNARISANATYFRHYELMENVIKKCGSVAEAIKVFGKLPRDADADALKQLEDFVKNEAY
ncbi:MAG: aminopeptidase [Nanoarchaeota archaeon]|nr:aminopeptidase [Nanoarchaeota archaeon]